jgi:hypothetical protein
MELKFKKPDHVNQIDKIFYETCPPALRDQYVCFTSKEYDYQGYPSLYRLYMEEMDPTEFRFAEKYFCSYEHWIRITQSYHYKDVVDRWRRDLDMKIKAQALNRIMAIATTNHGSTFNANKYLLEGGYKNAVPKHRGRPSTKEIAYKAEEIARSGDQVVDDYKRLLSAKIEETDVAN